MLIDDEGSDEGPMAYCSIMEDLFWENSLATVTHTNKKENAEEVAAELLTKNMMYAKDVETLLDMTHFRRNVSRKNVTPTGSTFVYSEIAGMVKTRTQRSMISVWTQRYPTVVQVINTWVKQNGWTKDEFIFPALRLTRTLHQGFIDM